MKGNIKNILVLMLILMSILVTGCKTHQDIFIPNGDIEKIGVYAYLNNCTETTCAVADTWYAVEGEFINNPIEGFYLDTSIPAIVYNSTTPRYILVETITSISASVNGVSVTGKIVKNNETAGSCGNPSIYMKYSDDYYSFSGNEILYMEQGDYLTIEIMCDKPAIINFSFLSSNAQKFLG